MISYIQGAVKYKTLDSLIILVQGIGYEVFVGAKAQEKYQNLSEVELYVYQNVREDALTLFGFDNRDSLELFKKLISISGVGPKTALNVLEHASVEDIIISIQNDDPILLTKVSGIGKKTAQRVILELKNKIGFFDTENLSTNNQSASSDEIDALIALGYSETQARETLTLVPTEIVDISERIKACLKYLSKK